VHRAIVRGGETAGRTRLFGPYGNAQCLEGGRSGRDPDVAELGVERAPGDWGRKGCAKR
jgi:hypothetical protein